MIRLLVTLLGLLPLMATSPQAQTGDLPDPLPSVGVERMEAAAAFPVARLQGLDKVTARISTFEVPVDAPAEFGTLEIRVRSCWKNPPEETPEAAAYLEIRDSVSGDDEPVFSGWMYASSPAVNALEHAVYDVWVLDCLFSPSEAAPSDAAPAGSAPLDGEQSLEAAPGG